jgi:hypothetical protein
VAVHHGTAAVGHADDAGTALGEEPGRVPADRANPWMATRAPLIRRCPAASTASAQTARPKPVAPI